MKNNNSIAHKALMKRIALLLLLLPLMKGGMAQDEWYDLAFPKEHSTPLCVALTVGLDNNTHVVDMMYATDMRYLKLPGYAVGLSALYNIKGWATLRADFIYLQKNYMMYRMGYKVNDVHTETSNDYLSLPIVAQFSVGGNFRAFGCFGGYVGYWLKSHRQGMSMSMNNIIYGDTEGGAFDEDVLFSEVKDNRVDYGLVYGAGLACTLKDRVDISFEARCFYGLSDVQKPYMSNLIPRYNTTMAYLLGVGYRL